MPIEDPLVQFTYNLFLKGSGCDSVGRAVASDPEAQSLNPVIGKVYIEYLLSIELEFENTKINEKEDREWPIRKIFFIIALS